MDCKWMVICDAHVYGACAGESALCYDKAEVEVDVVMDEIRSIPETQADRDAYNHELLLNALIDCDIPF